MNGAKVPDARTTRDIFPSQPVLEWDGTYLAGETGNVYFARPLLLARKRNFVQLGELSHCVGFPSQITGRKRLVFL